MNTSNFQYSKWSALILPPALIWHQCDDPSFIIKMVVEAFFAISFSEFIFIHQSKSCFQRTAQKKRFLPFLVFNINQKGRGMKEAFLNITPFLRSCAFRIQAMLQLCTQSVRHVMCHSLLSCPKMETWLVTWR